MKLPALITTSVEEMKPYPDIELFPLKNCRIPSNTLFLDWIKLREELFIFGDYGVSVLNTRESG